MQIKRFEAPTMSEALRLIKKEFGPDAVILSARSRIQEKTLFGIKKPAGIEVTAATDSFNDAIEAQDEVREVSAAAAGGDSVRKGQKISVRLEDPVAERFLLNRFQRNPSSSFFQKATQMPSSMADDSFKEKFATHFARQGVEAHFIQEMLASLSRKSDSEMNWGSPDFHSELQKVFSEMGISAGIPENTSRRQIHGFVGPAGSGKTSVMARLTAIYTRQFKQNVGWITLDTQRVGAVAQLQVYARIIGVPVEPVATFKEFKEALKRFANMDHIFVDTPGMGIRDEHGMAELSEMMKQAHVNTMYLVVSAPTKYEDLIQIVSAYRPLSLTRLIVSKLDESRDYGNVFNLLVHSKLPVSYFTSGQTLPNSLEKATLEKLVELMLNPDGESLPWQVPPGKTAEIIPYVKNTSSRFRNHFVAKNNAVLFHHPDCAWAKRIKTENRIVFESIEEATSKHYIPCKTCCSHIPETPDMAEAEVHRVGNGQPFYSR